MDNVRRPDTFFPENNYVKTQQLIHQIEQAGWLLPLMHILKNLLADPVLKKTMEESHPAGILIYPEQVDRPN